MSQYGYEQPKKKNQVTESMISTVSQAFEFEDFLGQKTTLKDRVPKNKANLANKVVHFTREVNDDRGFASNTLPNYNANTSFQKRNTFENYMSDDFYDKLREQESSSSSQPKSTYQPYQSPTYTPPQPSYFEPPKYSDYSTGYSYTPSTSSPYSSSPVTPDYKSNYRQEPPQYQSSKFDTSYQPEYNKTEYTQPKNQYESQSQNNYSKPYTTYTGYNTNYQNPAPQTKTYTESHQSFSYKEPVQSSYSKSSVVGQSNDWSYKPTGVGSSGSYSTNSTTSGLNNYSSPQSSYSQSYSSYKPYEPPAVQKTNYGYERTNNTYSDRGYDSYGDYAKDFSSPDIMAILNKRKKQ